MSRESLALSLLFAAVAFTPASLLRAQGHSPTKDILYIGDGGDDTIKRFDASRTYSDPGGNYLDVAKGPLVPSGSAGLHGPRGIIIDSSQGVDDLIVVNQHQGQPLTGDILKYSALDGQFLGTIVQALACDGSKACDPKAPFAPRGIVSTGYRLFVADNGDITDCGLTSCSQNPRPGRIAQFDLRGNWLGNLDFGGFNIDGTNDYHPRGLVFGPDGMLYVSVSGNLISNRAAGFVLRFEIQGQDVKFHDVFASNPANSQRATCPDLHRPEGLTFGPDGKLYVASFRKDPTSPVLDTDKIIIIDRNRNCTNIPLEPEGYLNEDRVVAEALLFGPRGDLFVPVTNLGIGNSFTGDVRRYNVHNKKFDVFVKGLSGPAQLTQPWYLTFGKTDPGTLAYKP